MSSRHIKKTRSVETLDWHAECDGCGDLEEFPRSKWVEIYPFTGANEPIGHLCADCWAPYAARAKERSEKLHGGRS